MKDAHARHTHEYGVVDEVLHGVQRLVATHSAHVEVLVEVELVLVDGLTRLAAYAERWRQCRLRCLRGVLKARCLHLRAHVAEHHRCLLALYRLHATHSRESAHAHSVASLKGVLRY